MQHGSFKVWCCRTAYCTYVWLCRPCGPCVRLRFYLLCPHWLVVVHARGNLLRCVHPLQADLAKAASVTAEAKASAEESLSAAQAELEEAVRQRDELRTELLRAQQQLQEAAGAAEAALAREVDLQGDVNRLQEEGRKSAELVEDLQHQLRSAEAAAALAKVRWA